MCAPASSSSDAASSCMSPQRRFTNGGTPGARHRRGEEALARREAREDVQHAREREGRSRLGAHSHARLAPTGQQRGNWWQLVFKNERLSTDDQDTGKMNTSKYHAYKRSRVPATTLLLSCHFNFKEHVCGAYEAVSCKRRGRVPRHSAFRVASSPSLGCLTHEASRFSEPLYTRSGHVLPRLPEQRPSVLRVPRRRVVRVALSAHARLRAERHGQVGAAAAAAATPVAAARRGV